MAAQLPLRISFQVNNGIGESRIANTVLNCNLAHISQLLDMGVLQPTDTVWDADTGNDASIFHMFVLRDRTNPHGIGLPLIDVAEEQLQAAIRLLVERGFNINYTSGGDPVHIRDERSLYAHSTALELAIYFRKFPLARFLASLGANPPRPIPFLAAAIAEYNAFMAPPAAPAGIPAGFFGHGFLAPGGAGAAPAVAAAPAASRKAKRRNNNNGNNANNENNNGGRNRKHYRNGPGPNNFNALARAMGGLGPLGNRNARRTRRR